MNTVENYKIKTALISVSDKSGLKEFAAELVKLGIKIYSTGGTFSALKEAGIQVFSVSDLTHFPEILDGRVKTLHPSIHGGLLAKLDDPQHLRQMEDAGIESIDLLVVNLYPFEETLKKNADHETMIENIDIGGPTMLRAAAKNYKWTVPVVNPQKYDLILNTLKEHDNSIPLNLRAEFAAEVFEHTAYYDSLIAGYFNKYLGIEYPEKLNLAFNLDMKLRYGENPHQSAALYGSFTQIFKHIHGKELSYNNVVDIDAAAKLILEFEPLTAVIVKHTNPCGVGTGKTLSEAYQKAYTTDTASAFGGIMTFNAIIDEETARAIHDLFTEVIVAPAFTVEALAVLQKKRDRRLIQADYDLLKKNIKTDFRSVTSGCLVQNTDRVLIQDSGLKVVTKRQPTESEITALNFAWRIAKHVKSNAIIFTSAERTLGVGAGQMSRVDSARIAAEKANMMGLDLKGSVVASDAYFPFPDGVEHAAKAGATAIIQPGGSVRDNLVIEAADRLNLAMVFTGIRHFRH